jgi:hypothetical protein
MSEDKVRKGNTKMGMPTIRQRKAFEIWSKALAENDPLSFKEIMMRAGYSEMSAINPTNLTLSRGWEVLKKELDGEGAKNAFNELVASTNEDKRTRLASAIEITKIMGGYPAQENKVIGIFGNLGELQKKEDGNRTEDTTGEDSIPSSSGTEESAGV